MPFYFDKNVWTKWFKIAWKSNPPNISKYRVSQSGPISWTNLLTPNLTQWPPPATVRTKQTTCLWPPATIQTGRLSRWGQQLVLVCSHLFSVKISFVALIFLQDREEFCILGKKLLTRTCKFPKVSFRVIMIMIGRMSMTMSCWILIERMTSQTVAPSACPWPLTSPTCVLLSSCSLTSSITARTTDGAGSRLIWKYTTVYIITCCKTQCKICHTDFPI